jgi:hypothetical protein
MIKLILTFLISVSSFSFYSQRLDANDLVLDDYFFLSFYTGGDTSKVMRKWLEDEKVIIISANAEVDTKASYVSFLFYPSHSFTINYGIEYESIGDDIFQELFKEQIKGQWESHNGNIYLSICMDGIDTEYSLLIKENEIMLLNKVE